jgi:hypothetical protein
VAAAAGLLGVRTSGHGRALEVSGLPTAGSCTSRRSPGLLPAPSTCWAGWTPWSSLRWTAKFANLLKPDVGAAVGEELEPTLATRPRDEWLAAFAEAGVPAAPARTRAEWLDDEIVASAAPPVTLAHPVLGRVAVPGVPIGLPATPGAVRHLPGPGHVVGAGDLWREPAAARVPEGSAPDLPLTGLRVVDLSTFLAAPFASAVLADLEAAVVKVETTGGDGPGRRSLRRRRPGRPRLYRACEDTVGFGAYPAAQRSNTRLLPGHGAQVFSRHAFPVSVVHVRPRPPSHGWG